MNIVDFLIVGDELREDRGLFDVPDGAGGVDGAGTNEVGKFRVPVE